LNLDDLSSQIPFVTNISYNQEEMEYGSEQFQRLQALREYENEQMLKVAKISNGEQHSFLDLFNEIIRLTRELMDQ